MAKFHGVIGFATTKETSPGVYEELIEEKTYTGEVNSRRCSLANGTSINDDISISDEISIVADPFATQNYFAMRYITYMGAKWKITNVSVQFPRLVLSLGGLYNE